MTARDAAPKEVVPNDSGISHSDPRPDVNRAGATGTSEAGSLSPERLQGQTASGTEDSHPPVADRDAAPPDLTREEAIETGAFCQNCDDAGGWICNRCGGEGWIVTCIDDLCRNSGECMHGDGEDPCPDCGGEGFVECDCRRLPAERADEKGAP